jgi:hypothetical protein
LICSAREASGGDHAAQLDGAVTDDGGGLAATDLGGDGRTVAGPHHVREREQRRRPADQGLVIVFVTR